MLGEKIKLLRKEKGITQADLANALNVTRSAVALWETDNTDPDIKNVIALAKFFAITTDFLFGLEDESGGKSYTTNNYVTNNFGTVNKFN